MILFQMICDICDKEFGNLRAKTLHINRAHHAKLKKRNCRKCRASFPNVSQLRTHQCTAFEPSVPEFMLENEQEITQELTSNEPSVLNFQFSGIKCYKCNCDFSSHNEFTCHVNSKCQDFQFGLIEVAKARHQEMFKCHKCHESFHSHFERLNHLAQHMKCTECPKDDFQDLYELRLHVKKSHSHSPCYACHLTFSTISALKSHFSNHHKDHLTAPPQSLKELTMQANCRGDKTVESVEEAILSAHPYFSSEADLVWRAKLKQILYIESLKSKNVITYVLCAKCKQRFSTKQDFFKHKKNCFISSTINPEQCESKAKTKVTRRRRRRQVTKKSSFACHLCNVSFHWKVDLRHHLRSEHGVQHRCENCQQIFCSKAYLDRHAELCKNKVDALVFEPDDDDDDE